MIFRRKHKLNAQSSTVMFNGELHHCPSKLEAAVGGIVDNLRVLGEASELRAQHSVRLDADRTWKVDYSYFSKSLNERVWVEAKGKRDARFRKNLKLWRDGAGPGRLEIWEGHWSRPICIEVIYPSANPAQAKRKPLICPHCQRDFNAELIRAQFDEESG